MLDCIILIAREFHPYMCHISVTFPAQKICQLDVMSPGDVERIEQ